MYAGRVACCPLVSHVEYAARALLRLEIMRRAPYLGQKIEGTDRQTHGRPPDHYTTLTAIYRQRNNQLK